MGSKVRIELNSGEIRKLLRGDDVKAMLKKAAESKAQGWETDTRQMQTRQIASVYTSDREKMREELDSHRIVGGLK